MGMNTTVGEVIHGELLGRRIKAANLGREGVIRPNDPCTLDDHT